MIRYDSHSLLSLCQRRGSVLPMAALIACPSTVVAFVIKYLSNRGILDLSKLDLVSKGSVYSGFTFVLGFVLVFRTSTSYSRYWIAATNAHKMKTEWYTACASCIAFLQISKHAESEKKHFANTLVRLFSLLHAMALEEIASLISTDFPLIDIAGLDRKKLSILTSDVAQGRKAEIVFQWIKAFIIKSNDTGLLNVPTPILTRVYQQLGTGLVHYHEAQQVVIWPFPYPYAQMNVVLIAIYLVITPFVLSDWTKYAYSCAIFTFISCVSMLGLEIITIELENPFGDDENDLPTLEMQMAINRDLIQLLNPASWSLPGLLPTAITDYEKLVDASDTQLSQLTHMISIDASPIRTVMRWSGGTMGHSQLSSPRSQADPPLRISVTTTKKKNQDNWSTQHWPESQEKMKRFLAMASEEGRQNSNNDEYLSELPVLESYNSVEAPAIWLTDISNGTHSSLIEPNQKSQPDVIGLESKEQGLSNSLDGQHCSRELGSHTSAQSLYSSQRQHGGASSPPASCTAQGASDGEDFEHPEISVSLSVKQDFEL